ncbi:MAG: prolyl oligopeptidase family serine peptidase, partial [Pseudomonadota bacterium]
MIRSLMLMCLFTATAGALAEPLPLEYFARSGDYLDVSLSPSGKRLAARAQVNDKVVVVIVDRASGDLVGGIRTRDNNAIHSVEWVNDERLVFSYAQERFDLDRPVSTGELYAINFDGTDQERLVGYRASNSTTASRFKSKESDRSSFELVDRLENDDKHILVIEYPWVQIGRDWYDNRESAPTVHRLNVYTGRKKKVEALSFNSAEPHTTKDGSIRFVTYQKADGYWSSAYRASDDAPWQPLDDVFDFSGAEMIVEGINEAGTAAFLSGRYGSQEFRNIFRLDFATKTFEPVFTDLDADIYSWLVDPESGEIAAGKSMRNKPRYHYPETASKMTAIHKQLAKAFKGRSMDITSVTQGGNELMLRITSDTNPGEYYIFDTTSKNASFFWANMSWIDPRLLRPMLVDEVTTEDGWNLPVRLTLPDGDGPAPLIVHPHGGPHGYADVWEFNRDVQLLANRGYAVLQVNMRGSGGFGDKFMRAGYREWGGKMIDDIATATRWAMARPEIDASRVCAYGASYGGYAAYMLAIREPELLKCTVGYVGVYDLNLMYTDGDIPKNWGGVGYLERVIGRDEAQLNAFSPVNHAAKIQ